MRHNPFTRFAGARRGVALLLAIALLALASVAHAGPRGVTAPPDDLRKLVAYTGCAVSIAVAASTAQIYFAVFGCARIFIDEFDL